MSDVQTPVAPDGYDSTADTIAHIKTVREFLGKFASELWKRGAFHDQSKLESPEKEAFDNAPQRLYGLTYGSAEYRANMGELQSALQHHYANNSHHPEHYPNGVADFDLLDLVEMLCDWKAGTLRHADGDILASLEHNITRFGLEPQLASILRNTIVRMGWGGSK